MKILDAILNDEITYVEVAVERSRTFLPPPHSSVSFLWFSAMTFARILEEAHKRIKKPDYFNEVITAYRDLRKVSAPRAIVWASTRAAKFVPGFGWDGKQTWWVDGVHAEKGTRVGRGRKPSPQGGARKLGRRWADLGWR
jgi:hypothetical protein